MAKSVTVKAAWIGGACAIVAAVIGAIAVWPRGTEPPKDDNPQQSTNTEASGDGSTAFSARDIQGSTITIKPTDSSEKKPSYKATMNIQKYDLRDKITHPPEILTSDVFDAKSWPHEKQRITSTLIDRLQNTTYPPLEFTISGQLLNASQEVWLWMPPPKGVQGAGAFLTAWRPIAKIKPDSPFDLNKLFSGEYQGATVSGERADFRFRCVDRVFATSQVSITRKDGDFAFVTETDDKTTISILPRLKVVMIQPFEGKGDAKSDGYAGDLQTAVKTAVVTEPSLSLSGFKMEEIEEVRSELQKWPFTLGPIKGYAVENYAVDVIVTVTIIATPQ